jgi:hypothetical protein
MRNGARESRAPLEEVPMTEFGDMRDKMWGMMSEMMPKMMAEMMPT